jgi:hypothetical protein
MAIWDGVEGEKSEWTVSVSVYSEDPESNNLSVSLAFSEGTFFDAFTCSYK